MKDDSTSVKLADWDETPLMTKSGSQNNGKDMYYYDLPTEYTTVIFQSNSRASQTINIALGSTYNAYYCTENNNGAANSPENVQGFVYDSSSTSTTTTPSTSTTKTLSKSYTVIGYIDGKDVTTSSYKFASGSNGEITFTCTSTSYIYVKDSSGTSYMTDGWQGSVSSVTLYSTSSHTFSSGENKLMISSGTVTLTLVENSDGSLTLSYKS
jgi:hypothetical protein